jgi:hypothetical protein
LQLDELRAYFRTGDRLVRLRKRESRKRDSGSDDKRLDDFHD